MHLFRSLVIYNKKLKEKINNEKSIDKRRLLGVLDLEWYLFNNEDVRNSPINPKDHWIYFGYKENRSPNQFFDPYFYKNEYFKNMENLDLTLIEHYLFFGFKEGKLPSPQFPLPFDQKFIEKYGNRISPLEVFLDDDNNSWQAMSKKTGALTSQITDLKHIVPSLRYLSNHSFQKLRINSKFEVSENSKALSDFISATKSEQSLRNANSLLLIPHLVFGGSDKYSMYLAENLPTQLNAVAILTDSNNLTAKHWIPNDFKIFNLHEYIENRSLRDQTIILKALIENFQIEHVFGVGSKLLYETLRNFGSDLSNKTSFYVTLFCHDYDNEGFAVAYASEYFIDVHEHVKYFLSDTKDFPIQLQKEYGFPDSYLNKKFKTIYSYVSIDEEYVRNPSVNSNNKILWAARGDKQKNLPLLLKIAEKLKEFEFHIYGSGDFSILKKANLTNVYFHGPYRSFKEIDYDKFSAYLYTSLWDGLPISILEAGSKKIPIIASKVGGVPELLNEKNGWICESLTEPFEYVSAILDIYSEQALAKQKSQKLFEDIKKTHSKDHFRQELHSLVQTF